MSIAQRRLLGELLVDAELVSRDQLTEALEAQHCSEPPRPRIGRVACQRGWVTQEDLAHILARQFELPFADVGDVELDPLAGCAMPAHAAERLGMLPLKLENGSLVVAMSDPTDVVALDDARMLTGRDIRVVVTTEDGLRGGFGRLRQAGAGLDGLFGEPGNAAATSEEPDEDRTPETPVVQAVERIIAQASREGASDIHIEPWERDVLVRFRVDGVLRDVTRFPRHQQDAMTSRVKILAALNIAERRVPQDGRMTVTVDGSRVDLRIATLPGRWGEKLAIRLLSRTAQTVTLEDLGFEPETRSRFTRFFRKPHGAILVTGPTGSGKSTTLYAALGSLNAPGKSIVTIEDPIEYLIPRVLQVQVNPKAGLTFASGLRSILRCDPDIVMVGEIRDRETAMIAMESALTGHVVLSTLHTNDAPSALTRLIEMGVEPFVVASSVEVVLAQRLVRRLCSRCKQPEERAVADAIRQRFPSLAVEPVPELYRAVGCASCFQLGYSGRVALVELMPVTDGMRGLVMSRRPADEIRRAAIDQTGMRMLLEDGVEKVGAGVTTASEMLRVVTGEDGIDADDIPIAETTE